VARHVEKLQWKARYSNQAFSSTDPEPYRVVLLAFDVCSENPRVLFGVEGHVRDRLADVGPFLLGFAGGVGQGTALLGLGNEIGNVLDLRLDDGRDVGLEKTF
jgi:hypothetical protein